MDVKVDRERNLRGHRGYRFGDSGVATTNSSLPSINAVLPTDSSGLADIQYSIMRFVFQNYPIDRISRSKARDGVKRSKTAENRVRSNSDQNTATSTRAKPTSAVGSRLPSRRLTSGALELVGERARVVSGTATVVAPSMGPRRPGTRPVAPGSHDRRRGGVGSLEVGSPADVLERVGMEPRENDEFVGKFVDRRQFVPAAGPLAAPIQSRRSASVCRRPSVSQWPDANLPTSSGSVDRSLVRWRRG